LLPHLQPSGESVFLQLQKKQDKTWTPEQMEKKLQKWNESCWKMTVYTIFSTAALLVSYQEPWLLSPVRFWDGATAFPINCYVPFKIVLFYLLEIGFYIQAIPFLFFVEVRVPVVQPRVYCSSSSSSSVSNLPADSCCVTIPACCSCRCCSLEFMFAAETS
jgi:hypothetical protein